MLWTLDGGEEFARSQYPCRRLALRSSGLRRRVRRSLVSLHRRASSSLPKWIQAETRQLPRANGFGSTAMTVLTCKADLP